MFSTCFLSSFQQIRSTFTEKSKISRTTRNQAAIRYSCWRIGPNEDVKYKLHVKLHQIPFSHHLCWWICMKNTNLVEEVKNSYVKFRKILFWQRLQRSRIYLNLSESRSAMFVKDWSKNTNLEHDVECLLPVKFRHIPFSIYREKVENAQWIRCLGGHLCWPIGPKHKLGRGRGVRTSC